MSVYKTNLSPLQKLANVRPDCLANSIAILVGAEIEASKLIFNWAHFRISS